jgi:LuxR family maltose regulon positive regulatory protein
VGATGVPLLESKLHVPRRRRGVVARARLEGRVAGREMPPVVLVSAPAGFGKTTLLTSWVEALRAAGTRVAWVSLDHRDSDPAVFWSYVIAALAKAAPGAGDEASEALQTSPSALEAVVASLLNDLAVLDDDVVLVLDDYHVVESLELHESMRFLVEHLPQQVHVVVGCRADPPWPLSGLRARGELLEIRAADLRFTPQEAAAYLHDAMGLELAEADVEVLEDRTEGWIAALQLAALSLQGRDDPGAFIAEFAGDDRFVVDYLVDEVLDRQPAEVRRFLLETAVLHRLSGPLCAAVTGRSDAKSTLEALDRSNLFLVALDDRRQWYRYHHLFAEVLRARLADEAPDRLPELHHRASAWFEADGDQAEALRHALAAGDVDKAAELVELAIPGLRRARQEATQREWLDALPEEVFANRPVLSIARVGARMATGDTDGVAPLLDQAERLLDPDRAPSEVVVHDEDELPRLPTQVAMYRAALALLRGDLAAATEHGERAAALSAPDDHFGRGAAAALVGLARWADADLASGARQYAAAIDEFDAAQHYPDILGCSLGLADMQAGQGRLGEAERTLRSALEVDARHGPLRGAADMHVGLAEIHLERNELAAAAEHLRTSLELGERLALPQHAYRWRIVDARLRSIAGDHPGALAVIREAEARYNPDYFPPVRPAAATTPRLLLAAGDLDGALRWADAAGVAADDEPSYVREYEHLTLARVLLAAGRAGHAAPLLRRVLAAADAGGRAGNAAEAELLLAVAVDAEGDRAQALSHLAGALDRAEPEGFVRMFLDAGAPVVTLLGAAAPSDGRASALVVAAGAPAPARPVPQGVVDELSARELEVLRLLRSELSGPEIAAELVVSLNTVRTHTKNIFMKLGVNSRRAAVRRAGELGL